jgi:predicted DNA repair protein MutK
MAGSSLLALIDDIATVLDDVALMTKVAAKKTSGVLGDDLALNAQQVAGVRAEREIPVVWAVAKGSFINKLILVPAALVISAFIPWAIVPLLMIGGAFLCFEGFEKIAHKYLHSADEHATEDKAILNALLDPTTDMVAFEQEKIKGAVRTDFILSAEIIVISLGTVKDAAFMQQVAVLAGIGIIMTVGVYGLVAAIVKMDDAGLYLTQRADALSRTIGNGLLAFAPKLMKSLAVIGTAAMFMVGGSILLHGIPAAHHVQEALQHALQTLPAGGFFAVLGSTLLDMVAGLVAGGLVVGVVTLVGKLKGAK